jgi:hypothetical protein
MFFIILSMSVIQKEIIIMLQAPTGDWWMLGEIWW